LIAGGTAKTTPTGADTLPISDSAAAGATKTLTFTNLGTYLAGLCSAGWNAATATTATNATNAVNLTGSGTVSATTTGGAGLTPTNATNLVGSGTVSATTTGGTALTPNSLANVAAGTNYHGVPGWSGQYCSMTGTTFQEVANCMLLRSGTFTVSVASAFVTGNPTSYLQIYKNGSAFGTINSFNNSLATGTEIYNENLTFNAGDFMQVFLYSFSVSGTAAITGWKLGNSISGVAPACYASIGDR